MVPAVFAVVMLLWLPELAFAETLPETGLSEFAAQAGFGGSDVRLIIARLIRTVLSLTGIVLIIMLVYGGFLWMLSGGVQEKITKARGMIVNAVIGLVIILSAFAVTQFVIVSLVGATGAVSSVSDSTGGPGVPGCPTCPVDYSSSFVTESWGCLETLQVLPMNAQIQILFNRTVQTNPVALDDFIAVSAGSSVVEVKRVGLGQVVTVNPAGDTCPSEPGDVFCPGTTYTVTVEEGFLSADGVPIDCTIYNPCSYSFTTGNTSDNAGPSVMLNAPPDGGTVFSFIPLDLQASVVDDSGVGVTDFTVGSAYVDSAEPSACTGDGPMSCAANGLWTPGNLVPGSSHVIRATASDCSGNTATSSPVTVTALAPHCANEVEDEDETGIDCGGGDCLSCSGSSCIEASDCSSFLCLNGVCATGPKITNVSPRGDATGTPSLAGVPNGAPGNFITISGTGFGATPGLVTFLGAPGNDSDNTNAPIVACPSPSWINTQIVVAVPAGAASGSLQVTTGGTSPLVDATSDGYGPPVPDFVVNTIARPGLCGVIPSSGDSGDRLAIAGVNFGTDPSAGSVYFDGANVYEAAFLSAIDSWSSSAISILMPPATAGDYDLSVFVSGEGSNELEFEVTEAEATANAPRIDYVDSGVSLCVGSIAAESGLCATDADCGGGSCVSAGATGAHGQYVTIFGDNFGSATGTVLFADENTGDVTFVPDFPPQCSTNWWSDTAIVVQVPEGLSVSPTYNPKTIRVRAAGYPLTPESNTADFTVSDIAVTPGLCAVAPSAGPIGTPVTLYGDNLGESASDFEIRFYNGSSLPPSVPALSSTEAYISDQEIGANVPAGAATGPLSAVVDVSSNTLNFLVGDCNTVPNLCASAQVCCPSGACAASVSACAGAPVDAQYVYGFTTGPIPNLPTVIEQCVSYLSPTPSTLWEDGSAACVNANIRVAFSPGSPATAMNVSTLDDAGNVYVEHCVGTGLDPCEAVEEDTEGNPVHLAGDLSPTPLSVSFDPDALFVQNAWYQVTVTADVVNALGVALAEDYVFRFKTRNDATECEVEELLVSPANYTAVSSDPINYEALPTNGLCQTLDPDDYSYDWTLTNYGKDIVFPGNVVSVPGTVNEVRVLPNEETNAGQPALVNAGVVGFLAEDTEELIVDFTDPYVTEFYPQCATACVNASVGASFNTAMTPSGSTGVAGAHTGSSGLEENVRLFKCLNEICDTFAGGPLAFPIMFVDDPIDATDGREFFLNGTLEPSTYYRVMIWGGVESAPGPSQPNGVALWGETTSAGDPVEPLNYGDYYSWTFRTRADATACGIGSVDVSPASLILDAIGARGAFSAQPFGQPDSCSLNGQRLNPLDYPWSWIMGAVENPFTSALDLIATFLPAHSETATLDTSSAELSSCTGSCLNAGSSAYVAVCGNGVVNRNAVTGAWEDCDPTAPGWSAAECTSSCQVIGVSACDATLTSLCCGNGAREGREECDDGGNADGNGCSSACLNEGAARAGLTCGDGVVSHTNTLFPDGVHSGGEECDDGGAVSSDGCSSVCLREGSVNTSLIGGVVCGDGQIGAGEDCDGGNAVSGDGCSASCLQESLAGAWVFGTLSGVCGNGTLEPSLLSALTIVSGVGEECDDGNTVSGDGCSAGCLNEGSSIFYDAPSFCGDGDLVYAPATGGEECEVTESDDVGAFDPVQYVEIEPVAAQIVEDGEVSANLQATGSDSVTSTSALGTAVVRLNCSCESDSACGNATAIGCGLSGCCFERPEVDPLHTYPLTTTANALCRNTLVEVRFTDEMDEESFFAGASDTELQVFLELIASAGGWIDANSNGRYDASADTIVSVACPSSYVSYDTSAHNRFVRLFRRLVRVFRPTAFAETSACVLPAQLIPVNLNVGTPSVPDIVTRVQVQYSQALEPGAVYRLVVVADGNIMDATAEGVASVWNVTMNGVSGANIGSAGGYAGVWSNTFTTGTQICDVDLVTVEDESASSGLFTVAAESHPLLARPYHRNGPLLEPIVEVPGLYEWSWSGTEAPSLIWGWTSNPATPAGDVLAFSGNMNDTPSVTLATTDPAINGEETIQAQLRVDAATDPSIDTPGRIVAGSIEETVFLCENPWPAVGNFPFADTAEFSVSNTLSPPLTLSTPYTNFSFYYCRDTGEPADASDDLPALSIVEKTSGIEAPGIFKEFIFAVDDPDINDAIGVRILGNSEYQSPSDWFVSQGFVGAPSPETLDGFEAVQDGRTLYASAPNIGSAIAPLNGTVIYPNVYVAAYNEGASAETIEIYNRLLAQWSFAANENVATGEPIISNARVCTVALAGGPDPVEVGGATVACTSDADCANVSASDENGDPIVPFCDAQKDKLRRDFLRLSDLRSIGTALEEYGDTHGHCSVTKNQACFVDDDCSGTETCVASVPVLASGTFIPSMSASTWPSWQAQLGNALGFALPTDPLNAYANCPDGYDDISCYNALEALAQCPNDSYVYNYRSIGGESYQLEADLEYGNDVTPYAWAEPLDVFDLGEFFVGNAVQPNTNYPATGDLGGFETAPNCQSSVIFSAANVCGDGLVGSGEFCEVGQTSTVSCTVSVCTNTTDLNYNGDVCTTNAECGAGGSCNPTTGVKTVACYAPGEPLGGPGCTGYQQASESTAACLPYFCGDGIWQANGPDDIVGNGDDEICDDGPLNGQYGYCDVSCSYASAAFCGDGTLGGAEVCDCGASSAYSSSAVRCDPPSSATLLNGTYWADSTYGCSASCNGPQAYCGDRVVNGAETCDGEVEPWGGKLCADGTACTVNAQCASGACGAGAAACPVSSDGFDQVRTRICQGVVTPIVDSCTWGSPDSVVPPLPALSGWSACEPTGACGNGVREGAEACDDGDTDNQDGCIINQSAGVMCQLNVCGDGYRNIGVEACDLGDDNGEACTAPYGGNCTSCSNTCNFLTTTGDYCGDGEINGGEYCDGEDIPSRCYRGTVDPSLREIGDVCGDGYPACPDGFACNENVGLCNGGVVTIDSSDVNSNGAPCRSGSAPFYTCGTGGECVVQDCNNTCAAACPFTLNQGAVQVQAEGSSSRTNEVNLYSYLAGPAPDEAVLYFPACTVGASLLADVSFENVLSPQVDVLFLVDLSRSMLFDVDGNDPADSNSEFMPPDRISIVENGLLSALDALYDAFTLGNMQVALVGFTSPIALSPSVTVNSFGTAATLHDFTESQSELEEAVTTLLTPISGTTTADGLDWAYNLLQARANDPATANRERIVVLLTDGIPSADLQTDFSLAGPSTLNAMQDAYNVAQALQDEAGLDVKIYTGAFTATANSASIAAVNHFSSNECGDEFTDLEDCQIPEDGVNYAYNAQTEAGFNEMIGDIVDNILGLNVSYLTETGSEGGAVMEGNDVTLPFPPGFACEEVNDIPQTFTIPFFTTFNSGDPLGSTVNLSNFRLEYCPFQ